MVVVINIWVGIPFTMLQVTGVLQNIPADLYEAATVDGAGPVSYTHLAVRLGVSDYILKPVDPSEFKETITRVIQELEAERAEKNMKKKSMQQMREHALYQIVNGVNVAEAVSYTHLQRVLLH